ncbi:hypothetical protein Tco_0737168 [Tanacetum coccineum]
MNNKKPNNRSNKRNIKLPIRYNDHNNEELGEDKLRDDVNEISNLNDRFNNIGDDGLDKTNIDNAECVDSDKECLDDGVKENKQDEISSEYIDKLVMDEKDKNKADKVENQNGPNMTYANVTKNSKSFVSNQLRVIPTVMND